MGESSSRKGDAEQASNAPAADLASRTGSERQEHELNAVFRMGRGSVRRPAMAILGAALVHGAVAARTYYLDYAMLQWTNGALARVREQLVQQIDIETEPLPAEPEPPPPPPEPVAVHEPPPERTEVPPPSSDPPAAAAAQAGAVLTADDDSPVADLSNTIVFGSGDVFAGGVTDRAGTSKAAVVDTTARGRGSAGLIASPPPPPKPDRTVVARCGGTTGEWQCAIPSEAEFDDFDQVRVLLDVSVNPDGAVSRVDVISDPGRGFGREAQRCALSQRCLPAANRDGLAVATVRRVRVTFTH